MTTRATLCWRSKKYFSEDYHVSMYFLNYLYTLSKNNVQVRGRGSFSILDAQWIIEAQILDAKSIQFFYLWSKFRCANMRSSTLGSATAT